MADLIPSWHIPLLERVADTSIAEGKVKFDEEYLHDLLHRLRVLDDAQPVKNRLGFAKVDDYSARQRVRFLRRVAPILDERTSKDPSLLLKSTPPDSKESSSATGHALVPEPMIMLFHLLLESDNYPVTGLQKSFEGFLQKKLAPAVTEVLTVVNMGNCKYEVELVSSANTNRVWETFNAISWCKDVRVKPRGLKGVSWF